MNLKNIAKYRYLRKYNSSSIAPLACVLVYHIQQAAVLGLSMLCFHQYAAFDEAIGSA